MRLPVCVSRRLKVAGYKSATFNGLPANFQPGTCNLFLALVLTAALLLPSGAALAAPAGQFTPERETLGNEAIEADVSAFGQFTIGTVAGDPGTPDDDERRLMFGHGGGGFTSFTSARIIRDGAQQDFPLLRRSGSQPEVGPDVATMRWQAADVDITQELAPALNPYTDRADTMKITVSATNNGTGSAQVGIRVMLDTMIGGNDRAPFFVPGTGNFDVETEYAADQMPAYWKAFEAPDYSPTSLKGQGILTGFGATPPDRFVIARWPHIKDTVWDYEITEGENVGDSAVALYWFPVELAVGESVTWVTYYGLAGMGGGSAWFDAPVNITSPAPEFAATFWVSNLSDADFTGGEAVLTLPPGLQLAEGETLNKPMPTVPVNGGAQSVIWRLVGTGDADADYPYSATVTFADGSPQLSAESSVHYQFIAAAQPAATATLTPEPTETPAPVVPLAPAPRAGLPWWPLLLLIPLLAIPLIWLLTRRKAAPVRTPPPRTAPHAPPARFDPPAARPASPTGADVTHGRKKPPRSDV